MITFNVYYGLNAWTNHTFVANEFCSNGGNAYVCITPGPSTTAPTGTGAGINNGGIATFNFASVVNYTSLQAWATDMFNTYGTPGQPDNFTVETWASAVITMPMVTPSSPYLSWGPIPTNGFSTLIRAYPGFSFRDAKNALTWNAANGVAFDAATGTQTGGQYFFVNVANTTLQGLQFRDTNVDAGSAAAMIDLSAADCVVRDCILDGYDHVYMPLNNSGLVDCLIANRCTMPLTSSWPVKWDTPATGAFIEGCVFAGLGGGAGSLVTILTATAGVGVARNCIFFGATKPLLSQNVVGAWTIDHCALSISALTNDTTDGGGNLLSQVAANLFISATVDFRPKTGAATIGAGATDTTYNTVGDDIFENTRVVPWDIGPVKFLGATSSAALAGGGGLIARAARLSLDSAALHGSGGMTVATVKASSMVAVTLAGAGSITGPLGQFTTEFTNEFTTQAAALNLQVLVGPGQTLHGAGSLVAFPVILSAKAPAALSGAGFLGAPGPFSQDFSGDFAVSSGVSLELLATAQGMFAGAGLLNATAVQARVAAATLAGSGAVVEQITARLTATASLAGSGILSAIPAQSIGVSAGLAGTGVMAASAPQLSGATAHLSAACALIATPLPLYWASFVGASAAGLAAALNALMLERATLSGVGTITAIPGIASQQFAAGIMNGAGGLIVGETSVVQLGGTLSGAGSLSATIGQAILAVAAALPGAGSLHTAETTTALAVATLGGAAALTSLATRTAPASVAMSGAAALSATTTLLPELAAAFAGSGTLSAAVIARIAGAVTLQGSGALTVAPGQPVPTAAFMTAQGSLAATATGSATGIAIFQGIGSLFSVAPLALASAAVLNGSGSTVIGETSALVADAMLDGDGVMVATAPAELTFTLNGAGGLIVAEFVISERSGIGVFAAQMQRGAFATDATENQERPPVFGVVTSAQPQRLGDLRAGTEDTRFYDLGDDLGPLGDWVITAAVIVARRDGATLVQPPDLVITPVGLRIPWLSAAADYPALALTVNWWEGADPTNPGADYLVTVQVTTQQGRVLEYDAYQMVVEDTG